MMSMQLFLNITKVLPTLDVSQSNITRNFIKLNNAKKEWCLGFEFTKHAPYRTLTSEIWGIFSESFVQK